MYQDKLTVSARGNIVKMETKTLPSGAQVTNFSIAKNEFYKDRSGNSVEKVYYIDCSAWGDASNLMERYCKKGTRIMLDDQPIKFGIDKDTGKPNGRFSILVNNFDVIRNGKDKNEQAQNQPANNQHSQPPVNQKPEEQEFTPPPQRQHYEQPPMNEPEFDIADESAFDNY